MNNVLFPLAYAMGSNPSSSSAGSNAAPPFWASPLMMFMIIIIIFYIFLIIPQRKERKKLELQIKNLKKGDKIITSGGIHGIVANPTGDPIKVKIADNVKIDISRSAIIAVVPCKESEENGKEDEKTK